MVLLFLILTIILLSISWLLTCGIIYLITLCFGIAFSWGIATGIWLILLLIGKGIKVTVKHEH
jgi:hypothetical protein